MQPVVAETSNRLLLPFRSEVVALQELDKREGEDSNGEVQTISVKLTTGHMIETVVMFEFTDHLLELTTTVLKMNHRLCIFLVVGDVGRNDPVMVGTVKEIVLIVTPSTLCHQTKRACGLIQAVNRLSNLIAAW